MLDFCSACEAAVPEGAAFCEECGEPVVAAPAQPRGETAASRRERQAMRRELQVAKKRVATLRLTYNALGVVFGLFLILFASWWWRFSTRGWSGTWVLDLVRTATIFSAVDAALMVLCARYVSRSPVVLGAIGAALVTVSSGLLLFGFPWSAANPLLLSAVITRLVLNLSLWALLPPAVRLRRLLEEHPELERQPRTRDGATERPPQWRLIARTAGPALLILFLGWWFTRPPTARGMASAFEEAWESGEPQTVGDLFERSDGATRWLRRQIGDSLPDLERLEVDVQGVDAEVTFDLADRDEHLVLGIERMPDGRLAFAKLKLR